MSKNTINVGFAGNPNCGKTTLFNAYTGANLKVANWPGVTVEKKEGEASYKGQKLKLTDLPGLYSLTSYSIEEKVTRRCIMEDDIDVIINVVDASALERNLYLTLQLLELGKPVILALNMMDIVEERGMEIDLHRLPELLGGIPVVPVSARKRTGLDVLMHAVVHHYEEKHSPRVVEYSQDLEERIRLLEQALTRQEPGIINARWHAIKLLVQDEEQVEEHPIDLPEILDRSYEQEIINQKYAYIEEIIEDTLFYKGNKVAFTDRVDEVLTHPIWGMPIFFGVMALVFFLTFTVGDFLKGYFEIGLDAVCGLVLGLLTRLSIADWLISLVVDGILAGVGGILTFLPNIFILFLALAILEDSGYMARVAYVMDGLMGRLGLSGKAFLPMVLGFGCTVPAIMATRALEKERDRRRTILVTPFMSCSARLPIYVLFAGMFFGRFQVLAALSMYVIGLGMAILVAYAAHRLEREKHENVLLIELPEYKTPNARTIGIYVWGKVKDYLTKAGTTIFVASIIIWFLLNFGTGGMVEEVSESFGAMVGRFLVPVLAPAGLGLWQVGVALISGISAKEVVVSSFCVLFGISNVNSAGGMTALTEQLASSGFGTLNAYCLMLFCLLYVPCAATIGVIRRETDSLAFTLKMILFQLLVAWGVSVLVFQAGRLFL
ncbi:MAG: ferrous iron transport protein B [Lachnospiraceae bacterium]|nr:ferrous iron transport protein B [Lachnospiraceae bacterium]MCI9151532.1 ferrous iron transport protein B [Lachnospiraceae bacterium]